MLALFIPTGQMAFAYPTSARWNANPKAAIARHVASLVLLIAGFIVTRPSSAYGLQAVRHIPDPIACNSCRVDLDSAAVLVSTETAFLSWTSLVARDTQGRYLVTRTYEPGQIAVFSSEGQYLRSFGRIGRGPGEFPFPSLHLDVDANNSIHAVSGNRWISFAADSDSVEATTTLAAEPIFASVTSNGHLLANYPRFGAVPSNLIHWINGDGVVTASFGPAREPLGPGDVLEAVRFLAASGDTAAWSARYREYRLDLERTDGTLLQSLVRDAPWWHPWAGDEGYDPLVAPPNPRMDGLWTSDGLIWSLVLVPDAQWRRPQESPQAGYDWSRVYDTILEVIDPLEGEVIARTRSDLALRRVFGPPGYLVCAEEMPDGDIKLRVFKVRLEK